MGKIPSGLCIMPIKKKYMKDLVRSAYLEGIRQSFGLESNYGISSIQVINRVLWIYAIYPGGFVSNILDDLDGYYLYTLSQSGYLSDNWDVYLRTDSNECRQIGRITISCIDVDIRHKVMGETLIKLANNLADFVD